MADSGIQPFVPNLTKIILQILPIQSPCTSNGIIVHYLKDEIPVLGAGLERICHYVHKHGYQTNIPYITPCVAYFYTFLYISYFYIAQKRKLFCAIKKISIKYECTNMRERAKREYE